MTSSVIDPEAVGHAIRGYFRKAKEQRIGRRYSPDPRHDKPETWRKAGEACIAAGADPHDWVEAAFAQCPHKGGPFANMLTGASATAWYQRQHGRGSGTKTLSAETPVQLDDLKALITTVHTIMLHHSGSARVADNREFLNACYFPFPSWLRVIIACCWTEFFPEVLAAHGQAAREYLQQRPATVRLLAELGYKLETVLRDVPAAIPPPPPPPPK